MNMPSQNLPKPNLPGQPVRSFTPAATPVATPVVSTTPISPVVNSSSQTVFNQKPAQLRQAQVIPGGLSRENPGGTPPKMQVSAPSSSSMPPMPSRPASPLDQLSLHGNSPVSPAKPVSPVKPAVQTPPIQSAPPTLPTPPTQSASPTQGPSAPKAPQPSVSKPSIQEPPVSPVKPKKKLSLPLLIGGGVLVVMMLGFLLVSLFKPKTTTTTKTSTSKSSTSTSQTGTSGTTGNTGGNTTASVTTITYWGLWEDSQILKEVIADFENKNPGIKIDYRKQSHRDYRERLQQAIISGNGPDIFRYHVDWVPMLSNDLAAMPSSVMSANEYKQTFYPTATNNLQVGGQIVGIPLMYEGLALLYNKEMLRTANLSVPITWAELRTAANKLTVPTNVSDRQGGNITRAGLAIGNAGNVDNFSDILALLIIQNGGNPAVADSQYVKDALTFYTNFIKQDKVWSDRLANSTTAFARGDVAMILAPSWRIHDIKALNPNLDFAAARVPQLDSEKPAAWASFWAEGVSNKSKNKDVAWSFLKYLSTAEVLRKFYNDASAYRTFGEIYPRVDMAVDLQNDPLVGAFVADAPIAKTWYLSSFTHDNGLNDQTIKYYEDAINAVLSGSTVEKALEPTTAGVNSVLTKYNSK